MKRVFADFGIVDYGLQRKIEELQALILEKNLDPRGEVPPYLTCPRCGELMAPSNRGRQYGEGWTCMCLNYSGGWPHIWIEEGGDE